MMILKPLQVINRGDSFKRKERGGPPISRPSIEISVDGCPEERVPRHFEKIYRVVFLGCTEVRINFTFASSGDAGALQHVQSLKSSGYRV